MQTGHEGETDVEPRSTRERFSPTPENPEAGRWAELNKQFLATEIERIAARLRRHAPREGEDAGSDASETAARERADRVRARAQAPFGLDALAETFGLSGFERDVLLLCAAVELEGAFADLCDRAQGGRGRTSPTFGLALATLQDAHWSATAPNGALRYWRLIEVGADALTTAEIRIDERVLHYLTGVAVADQRLEPILRPVTTPEHELPSSRERLAEQLAGSWSSATRDRPLPVTQLWGSDAADMEMIASAACHRLGLHLVRMRSVDIPSSPGERSTLARLWQREAILTGSALIIDLVTGPGEDAQALSSAEALLDDVDGIVLVSAQDPRPVARRSTLPVHVPPLTSDERMHAWTARIREASGPPPAELDSVVEHFHLNLRHIWDITRAVDVDGSADEEANRRAERIWDACREQARPRLDDLAQRIETSSSWRDLVLPVPQKRLLQEILSQTRHRTRVYRDWGFAGTGARGLGLSTLFAGGSGTGKTMAAEILAGELRLDLYRIDLSQVVNKYIGETEKNLKRIFDGAEAGGAVLLFDEADALFGKRTEVKDSHDRYANVEVSYLLQRMEAYRGLAILTTNMKSALDTAFLRRLRFVVQFPFPDAQQRRDIWRRVFPPDVPVEGLDYGVLAQLNVAGGAIRNIALNAAFLAAADGTPVRMTHILRAARREYEKLEKPLTESELRGWAREPASGPGPQVDELDAPGAAALAGARDEAIERG